MSTLEQTKETQARRRAELIHDLEFIRASIVGIQAKLGRALADNFEPEALDLQQALANAQARETGLVMALATMAEDISGTEGLEEEQAFDQRHLAWCQFWASFLPIKGAMLQAQREFKQAEAHVAGLLRGEGKLMADSHYRRSIGNTNPFDTILMQPAGDGPTTAEECAKQAERAVGLVAELEAKLAAYGTKEGS